MASVWITWGDSLTGDTFLSGRTSEIGEVSKSPKISLVKYLNYIPKLYKPFTKISFTSFNSKPALSMGDEAVIKLVSNCDP